ncbi:hypothetical protein JR316_0008607 [Psilocybe cubensis]|uniref:Uncharacterized protein n=3 Tax=Psilocybe cubensis TaxID=181762 RepID=A0A8H8CDM4_PSICU|nr:uncharacterized protein JR316_0013519 [Psilocybe cubensis]XP_047745779.1 hypothetical protein JR316_0008607 [Psilocybe cubensis]KAH9474204.1 hypothetical protein JR316_0013519 [Psilocybe cubensis]KAH9478154.1 hypothetical protein JR316_0008607 [Psilocybe cubensis]
MSSSDSFPSSTVEGYTLSASLNASMLVNLLLGVYTVVYGGTLYLYWSRKSSNKSRRVVIAMISTLYLLTLADTILEWYFLDWSFITYGITRDTIFWSSLQGPVWYQAVDNFLFSSLLIIWRCYHVWGDSRKVIAIPVFLLIAEIALTITTTVLDAMLPSLTSESNTYMFNNIATTLAFVSLGTTVCATSLIGYKIHSASKNNILGSRAAYKRIVVTIVESSSFYSLVLLVYAMTGVIPQLQNFQLPSIQATYYVGAVLSISAGLAPTVMVARLALTGGSTTASSGTIGNISGLQFTSKTGDRGDEESSSSG